MLDRTRLAAHALGAVALVAAPAAADPEDRPFDFTDAFYIANGIDPAAIIGRPDGTGPNSVIDNTGTEPQFNNVRVLDTGTAYDHSGHVIFFYVTGLLSEATFLDNAAGVEAREIAEEFVVYEFPRADNPLGAVFPKRQDFVADLSGGYFSNDPLGTWQINLVKYTEAAFNTPEGQDALADLAADNGFDLDGTPLIRTKSEVESLVDDGFATIFTPPADGSQGLRWFFCPVIEDPRGGAIAPDAHLTVTEGIPATQEFIDEFQCLQFTHDWCDNCPGDVTGNDVVNVDDLIAVILAFGTSDSGADLNDDDLVDVDDVIAVILLWGACPN